MPSTTDRAKVFTTDLCKLEIPMNWALSGNARNMVDHFLVDPRPPRTRNAGSGMLKTLTVW
ncbi:hypothetical protein HGP14_26805 [Rhizobium sp. P32RR-XVIII]|uniref:hypothetical protein n=1 Tax=Rhizobium sp. P32RR-XVIII TaxID=2726738 RepID=UPI001456C3C1|nr:hypothetical protein [Rhizobium sp. P32RR-XVIII]NLS06916.1 hypothetical protein [Rhizobium sp. P32RR-XVIII]